LLLQILTKGDQKSIELLNEHYDEFKGFFREIGNQKGNKWDDILVKFEWVQANRQYESKPWYAKLKYEFDEELVKAAEA